MNRFTTMADVIDYVLESHRQAGAIGAHLDFVTITLDEALWMADLGNYCWHEGEPFILMGSPCHVIPRPPPLDMPWPKPPRPEAE